MAGIEDQPRWGIEHKGRIYIRWVTLREAVRIVETFHPQTGKIVLLDPQDKSPDPL